MTGNNGTTVVGHIGQPDPFADPLVLAWDAVALGDRSVPTGSNSSDIAVLQRIHMLEAIPPPSDTFFANLERRLAHQMLPATAQANAPVAYGASSFPSIAREDRVDPAHFPGSRRHFMSLAVAVLTVLLIAGPLVFSLTHMTPAEPEAIPAAVIAPPEMKTLAQFEFEPPLWDMPPGTAWGQMTFSMFLVDPGASFSTDSPWYTSVDGPLLIVPVSGELIVQPAGPALVYREGSSAPAESQAETPVILRSNDAIAFSSHATATGTNPGSEPVRAVYGLVGEFDFATNNLIDVDDVTRVDTNYEAHFQLPTGKVSLSIRRLTLTPLDTFVYEREPGWIVLPIYIPLRINDIRIYDGAADGLSPDILADAHYASIDRLKYPAPGPHTLINIGEETVDLYFLVIEPSSDTATPVA